MEITVFMRTFGVVLLVLMPASFGGDEARCGEGEWIQGHRGCYFFQTELKSWQKAKQDCQNRGGFLLSVGSVAELRYVKDQLKSRIKSMDLLKWWVGLRPDPGQAGGWKWADGGEFNSRVSPWSAGEPNNADENEDCVEFDFKGKLNDATCNQKHPYVCEKIGGTTTTTTETTSAGTFPASPQKSSLGATTANSRNTVRRDTGSTRRRGDTKGPPVRVTTSDLPEAPFPVSTSTRTVSNTRSSDVEPDFTTHAQTTRTDTSAPPDEPNNYCDSSVTAGLNWPKTMTGSIARATCANGVATWKCFGFPPQWKEEPNIGDCASPVLKQVFTAVAQVENEPERKVSVQDVARAVSSLADITEKQTMSAQDVVLTSRALSSLVTKVDLRNSSIEEIRDVVANVVKATSNLLSENKTATWSELPKEDQKKSAACLLVGVENSAMAIAEVLTQPQVIRQKDENIDLELVVLDPKLLEEPEVVYGTEESADQFIIPSDMLTEGDQEGLTKIVFVTYYKIADLLQPETEAEESTQDDENVVVPARLVVSNVISVSVHKKTFQNLKTPIKFTMKHTKVYPSDAIAACVFWEFAKGSRKVGDWSVEGCWVVRSNASHTICQCDHLTNFAVLMDVQGVQISDVHEMSLQLITYVGCIISAVCLIVSWFTFTFLKCLQGERNSIHKNLVFCMFVAELLFLFGIDKTYNRILCASLAGSMHYFFLAAFTWMFVEGVHIVVMIVQVFDAAKSRMRWYYLTGYGIPAAVVVVSAAVNYEGYGTDKYCWLSVENYFIWSFAGPVAVILLVNATILTYAMSTVCKHSEYVIKEKNRSDSTRAWIQGALALEVLLGLTWVFGYFYINQETIVMAYIFTVLNSLQGVFIFSFHCLLNKKVRKEYKRVLDISRVTSTTNTRSATRSSLHRKQDPSYEM